MVFNQVQVDVIFMRQNTDKDTHLFYKGQQNSGDALVIYLGFFIF